MVKVKSPHGKFYDRRHDLVNCCEISIRNYHGYMFLMSYALLGLSSFMTYHRFVTTVTRRVPLVAVTVYHLSGAREFIPFFVGFVLLNL